MKTLLTLLLSLASLHAQSINLRQLKPCSTLKPTNLAVIVAVPATITTTTAAGTTTTQEMTYLCAALSPLFSFDPATGTLNVTVPAPPPEVWANMVSPAGTLDGVNAVFTLPSVPLDPDNLYLTRNGVFQAFTYDYTLAGAVVSFNPGSIPQPGDIMIATYRVQ